MQETRTDRVARLRDDRAPRLVKVDTEFPCGYGPRAIRLSRNRDRLFVGCKDGSVTAVDLNTLGQSVALCAASDRGVRSLCECADGWLLLGHDGGGVSLLSTVSGTTQPLALDVPQLRGAGAVGYVGHWGDDSYVISPRQGEAIRIRLSQPAHARDTAPPTDITDCGTLPGVVAMSGFARRDDDERWLVCKTGMLWQMKGGRLKDLTSYWGEFGRPGFVYDVAVVKPKPTESLDFGIYLSTDDGIFLLRRPRKEGDTREFRVDATHLPGMTGMCLAITHAVHESNCYLWVSDVEGSVHLFWSKAERLDRRPLWHRSGLRSGNFPVMRALARWTPSGTLQAQVCQICRNERIVVSSYSELPLAASPAAEHSDAILSWVSAAWLREHLASGDSARVERRQDWSIEALVAHQIEETARDPERLRQFLRNPGVALACSALGEIASQERDSRDTGRAAHALTLWTHTLIGAVHRGLRDPETDDYLGIIRWLRALGEQCPQAAGLHAQIAESIQVARKWGVFGSTYASRAQAYFAATSLANRAEAERKFDHLVYQSLVFHRRIDVEEEISSPASTHSPRTPWDLKYLHTQQRDFLAAAWLDHGCIQERSVGGAWKSRPLDSPRGFGRRILLGERARRPYLLMAPAARPISGQEAAADGETLELHFLDETAAAQSSSRLRLAALLPTEAQRAQDESAYSMLDLGQGRVAVGLLGVGGQARIGFAAIGTDGTLLPILPDKSILLRSAYPQLTHAQRNAVSALACFPPSPSMPGGTTTLFIGCGDGQVWSVTLQFPTEESVAASEPVLVGRLHAPIRALACSAPTGDGGSPLRVFAGDSDGSLIAFQALPAASPQAPRWVTLWSTREQGGAMVRIFPLDNPLREDSSDHLVVAITQQGMAVLVLDRPRCEERRPADEQTLRRIKVPGERLGRFSLGSSVFGAAVLPLVGEPAASSTIARLAVVTSTGTIRIVGLHHPKFTASRKRMFQELLTGWLEQLRMPSDQHVQGYLLRRPEMTYAAASALPAFLVRWILRFGDDIASWEQRIRSGGPDASLGSPRQWLPRHIRPLAALDAAWSATDQEMTGKLRDALLAAREIGDTRLFKEILEAVISRANHQLFAEACAAKGDSHIPFATKFLALLADLEEAMGLWVGSPGRVDIKMRITIAKSLLDGDTLWALAHAQARRTADDAESSAAMAMQARIRLVRDFLGHGDLLLAVETLRAANLALMRLCRRLHRSPDEDWSHSTTSNELPLESLPGFFEAVGDFAARAAHPRGALGEVAAHEICRTYALGMLACPSAVVRLASWMAETDPPLDMRWRVLDQLALLGQLLGLRLPAQHQQLLEAALGTGPGIRGYRDVLLSYVSTHRSIAARQAGTDNMKMIAEGKPFDEIILWLHSLARQLLDDAGQVDLGSVKTLLHGLTASAASEEWQHSRAFWETALYDLDRQIEQFPNLGDAAPAGIPASAAADAGRSRPVRPALVLFSSSLADWCTAQQAALREGRKAYRIFDPFASHYEEALDLVRRAALRFPYGAAVQKNLVLGVLGHGLLELLDEHLLEVWEVAQALDPMRAWAQDDAAAGQLLPGAAPGTAARFAEYLLQRAIKAEAIPKNLRSLQGLLSYTSNTRADAVVDSPGLPLSHLMEDFALRHQWQVKGHQGMERVQLDPRSYHFLRLTLAELAQNDQSHGVRGQPGCFEHTHQPSRSWLPHVELREGPPPHVLLRFSYPAADFAAADAAFRESFHLQHMVRPRPEPRFPSHGSGLYLANLAAAAAGWKLDLDQFDTPGSVSFVLTREISPPETLP